MSDTQSQNSPSAQDKDDISMIFAQMVMQLSNMAWIFLGHAPNPQTGEKTQDLEHARYFIDQLEMLAVKTRGNLDSREDGLLKQTLTGVRLAFVEAVSKPQPAAETPKPAEKAELPKSPDAASPEGAESGEPAVSGQTGAESGGDSHKKFSKKYGS